MGHFISPKNEFCSVFLTLIEANARGKFSNIFDHYLIFSYDGDVYHNHADSKNGHYWTSLANIEGSPLAVGGAGPNINKAETYDIATNTWTEVADYPYGS